MNPGYGRRLRQAWQARFCSPKDFIRRAILISLVFALAQACGMREFTSVLNGTAGSLALGWKTSAALGLMYVFLYLAFVLLVPVLLLAAAITAAWNNLSIRDKSESP